MAIIGIIGLIVAVILFITSSQNALNSSDWKIDLLNIKLKIWQNKFIKCILLLLIEFVFYRPFSFLWGKYG